MGETTQRRGYRGFSTGLAQPCSVFGVPLPARDRWVAANRGRHTLSQEVSISFPVRSRPTLCGNGPVLPTNVAEFATIPLSEPVALPAAGSASGLRERGRLRKLILSVTVHQPKWGVRRAMPTNGESRRSFLSLLTKAVVAVIGVCLGAPAIAYFSSPLWRKRGADGAGPDFSDAGPLADLPVGEWRGVTVEVVRRDGWETTRTRRTVWVRRSGEGDATVTVLSPICPHLGCPINWHPDAAQFVCPCHGGVRRRRPAGRRAAAAGDGPARVRSPGRPAVGPLAGFQDRRRRARPRRGLKR